MKHLLLHLNDVRHVVVRAEQSSPSSETLSRLPLNSLGTWYRARILSMWKGVIRFNIFKLGWNVWFPWESWRNSTGAVFLSPYELSIHCPGRRITHPGGGCQLWLSEYQKGWRITNWGLAPAGWISTNCGIIFFLYVNSVLPFFSVRMWGRTCLTQACAVGVPEKVSTDSLDVGCVPEVPQSQSVSYEVSPGGAKKCPIEALERLLFGGSRYPWGWLQNHKRNQHLGSDSNLRQHYQWQPSLTLTECYIIINLGICCVLV